MKKKPRAGATRDQSPPSEKIKELPVMGPRNARRRVRPLAGRPATARQYDPGYPEPLKRTPWVDEGEPNG